MTRFHDVLVFWFYMASFAVISGQAKLFWGSKNIHNPQQILPASLHHQQEQDTRLVPDTTQLDGNDSNKANDHTKRHHPDGFKENDDPQKSSEVTSSDDKKSKDEVVTAASPEEPVGVKAHHHHHHHKKSNAVGDPDDGSDDSDDDSDLDDSEWEELEEELEELMSGGSSTRGADATTTQVQVEVELVEDGDQQQQQRGMENLLQDNDDCDDDGDESNSNNRRPTVGGGGVGLRLGQRLQNHRRKQQQQQQQQLSQAQKDHQTSLVHEEQMLAAWQSYVYAPPSPTAWSHLKSKSRMLDGASKVRLDRRTLYSGLLLEWKHASATYRKFLEPNTSQSLQAALSMATQPQWRRSFPRANAIRLYDDLEPDQGCTLAMQETIAMALVRCSTTSTRECGLLCDTLHHEEKTNTAFLITSCDRHILLARES